MSSTRLALLGGTAVRRRPFPVYNSVGIEEKQAVLSVLETGILSDFVGAYHEKFAGGREVQAFEEEWQSYFGVDYAVTMNSATSGLCAAIGALGLAPGDEVIVSPYTMSASVTCVTIYGAVPVFVDVEEDYFCIDPGEVERRITPRTKAIVAVDLAGQAAALSEIMELAKKHGLRVIEDCAQAPGARYGERWAGTVGHIGVFSLNCHKTIQTGEGGVVVTNDPETALRLRLIRNHAEAVIAGMPDPKEEILGLYGWNFRMTEIEAAIGRVQLKKLERLNTERRDRIAYLNSRLSRIPGIVPPAVRPGCTHVYYMQLLRLLSDEIGVERDAFVKALEAEGVPASAGYVKPLYTMPLFRRRPQAHGSCPVVERLHRQEVIVNTLFYPPLTERDLDDVILAYEKVAENSAALRTGSN